MAINPNDDRHNNGNTGNKATPVLHAAISQDYEDAIVAWNGTATDEHKLPQRSEMIRQAVYAYIKPTLELIKYDWQYVAGTTSDLSEQDQRTADWLNGQYLTCVNSYASKTTTAMLGGRQDEAMAILTEQSSMVKRWMELNPHNKGSLSNAITMAKSIPESRTLIERSLHNLGVLALEQSLVEPTPRIRRTKEQKAKDDAIEAQFKLDEAARLNPVMPATIPQLNHNTPAQVS